MNEDTDIYRIAARVKNKAILDNGFNNLTPAGVMVCNAFVNTFKSFYDFAETLEDGVIKQDLMNTIRAQEEAPARLIAALHKKPSGRPTP